MSPFVCALCGESLREGVWSLVDPAGALEFVVVATLSLSTGVAVGSAVGGALGFAAGPCSAETDVGFDVATGVADGTTRAAGVATCIVSSVASWLTDCALSSAAGVAVAGSGLLVSVAVSADVWANV